MTALSLFFIDKDKDKDVTSLRFDQGLQINPQGAQHLDELRIVVG